MYKRLSVALLALLLCIPTSVFADSLGSVPSGSVVTIRVNRLGTDPGVSWLVETWHATPRDDSRLRNVLSPGIFTDVSVAVMPAAGAESLRLLMIATIAPGQTPSSSGLDSVIANSSSAIRTDTVAGISVRYNGSPTEGQDFAAYAVRGDTLYLASSRDVMRESLQAGSLSGLATFSDMSSRVDMAADGVLFATNEGGAFADFLSPLEQKWQMSLLLSAQDLEWMASSFDVIDSERVIGRILFMGSSSSALPDITDDAEFLGEAFRRKFIGENISYTSSVSTDGLLVALDFEVEGLESLWNRLFENGVFSIIRPE